MFLSLAKKTRTIRRFDIDKPVTRDELLSILECVRYVASAGNLQRIRYITLCGDEAVRAFGAIRLGGYLPDDKKPDESVAPTAYIAILSESEDPDLNFAIDVGISAEAIVLSAAEREIGACIVRNFDKKYFSSITTEYGYHPFALIALGYPAEEAAIIDIEKGESVKYFKDDNGINQVPKLSMEELVLN